MIAYPNIDPVAFEIGPMQIHWYGLAYAAGIVTAWFLGHQRAKKNHAPIQKQQVADLILYVSLAAILGGRLGYALFYHFPHYAVNPLDLFKIWEGGMSFHGGLLGSILGIWIFSRKQNIKFFKSSRLLGPPLCNWIIVWKTSEFYQPRIMGAR